jgi:hypothetical protein
MSMREILVVLTTTLLMVMSSNTPAQAQSAEGPRRGFSADEKQRLLADNLDPEIARSSTWAATDHRRATGVRLAQFILSGLATILAGIVVALSKKNPQVIAATTAAATGLVTILSGLPAAGFDFQATYLAQQNRANVLGEMKLTLQFDEPERQVFLRRLACVNKWTDQTDPTTRVESCDAPGARPAANVPAI